MNALTRAASPGLSHPHLSRETLCGLGIAALLLLSEAIETAYQMGVM